MTEQTKAKIGFKNPELLKVLVNSISPLIREAQITADEDGLHSESMDAANVAMVIFSWAKEDFTEYDVPTPTTWVVNLEDVKAALRRVKAEASVTIEITDSKLIMVTDDGSAKRTNKISLIDDQQQKQRVPNLQFAATAVIPSHHWTNAIEDAADTNESVGFSAQDDTVTIAADSTESTRSAKIELRGQGIVVTVENETNDDGIPLPTKKKAYSKFSSDYLKRLLEPAKKAASVEFKWGQSYPCRADYDLGKLKIGYIIAPRVDNSD